MQNEINERIEFSGKISVWIGDPCYVIPNELWGEACDKIYVGEHEANHVIRFETSELLNAGVSQAMLDNCACRKLAFIQCGTMYGDGVYPSMSGFEYGVDAGCLAAVPDYLIDPERTGEAERLGKFFDVVDYIGLLTDGQGIFTFYDATGPLEIIGTGDSE